MTEINTHQPSRSARSLQIATLLAELQRAADILAVSVRRHEEQARVSDPRQHQYPMSARCLRDRRENISATIRSLEAQL
jgi:hypothetical protein